MAIGFSSFTRVESATTSTGCRTSELEISFIGGPVLIGSIGNVSANPVNSLSGSFGTIEFSCAGVALKLLVELEGVLMGVTCGVGGGQEGTGRPPSPT